MVFDRCSRFQRCKLRYRHRAGKSIIKNGIIYYIRCIQIVPCICRDTAEAAIAIQIIILIQIFQEEPFPCDLLCRRVNFDNIHTAGMVADIILWILIGCPSDHQSSPDLRKPKRFFIFFRIIEYYLVFFLYSQKSTR